MSDVQPGTSRGGAPAPDVQPVTSNGDAPAPDSDTVRLRNWMGNATASPAQYVEARDEEHLRAIVSDTAGYPSPLRAVGAQLSPSALHTNEKGTVISMRRFQAVLGLRSIAGKDGARIQCVEAEAGVSLAALNRWLHSQNPPLEMAFSSEIGSATVGGVSFATTQDSSIGSKHHATYSLTPGVFNAIRFRTYVVRARISTQH